MKIKKAIRRILSAAVNPGATKREIKVLQERRSNNKKRRTMYLSWYDKHKLRPEDIAEQRDAAKGLKYQPLVSVLMPTYNTQPEHLRECIDSVLAQTYTNWELCIADDASPQGEVRQIIKEYAKKHKNIKYVFSKKNQHIAATSNLALELASGEYVSLLDHDDLLQPNALYEAAKAINDNPGLDLIYSDEDKLEEDRWHVEPFFKPDWSPDFLLSCNYITHFATLSRSVVDRVGGFGIGTEGAQDWDLFLRVTAVSDRIHHIPKILYTWRKSQTSTAQTADSKPYAYINQKKVLRGNLARRKLSASVEAHPARGFWRVRYDIQGAPLVSIVIPTKDNYQFIRQCVDSIIECTSYPYFEIIIVDTGSKEKSVQEYYKTVTDANENIRIVQWDKPFNFSGACNLGAKKAKGKYLLFLNNDTKVVSHDWIQGLLEHAQRQDVGMVGCKLLFPNMRIQHAGVVLSEKDIAFHAFYGQDPQTDIFTYIYADNIRNCAAVTAACSMVAKDKFDKVGRFDEKLRVTYNDVDVCLRLLDSGYKNVYTPYVTLMHYESVSVGKIQTKARDTKELQDASATMRKRWGKKFLQRDPYYNPNFVASGSGYVLE